MNAILFININLGFTFMNEFHNDNIIFSRQWVIISCFVSAGVPYLNVISSSIQ